MYKKTLVNVGILVGATLVFAGSLWLVRNQQNVTDLDYMDGGNGAAPLNRSPNQYPGTYLRSPRLKACRRNNRSTGAGD
jgi:hypothetical protein